MKATQNKYLPSKWFYIGIIFISVLGLLAANAYGYAKGLIFLPYILLIWAIGRNYQEKKNPDKIT